MCLKVARKRRFRQRTLASSWTDASVLRNRSAPGAGFHAASFDQVLEPLQIGFRGEFHAAHRIADTMSATADDVDIASRMIEAEKIDDPSSVGGATEVVVIDLQGFRWPHDEQHCE